ncbi:MAG: type II toxin-antitoxin system VapC family toxin [Tepidiformaceae bacterium]
MQYVVDASVTIALSMPDEASEYARRMLVSLGDDGQMLVPPIWVFEVANTLVVARRRSRLADSAAIGVTALLQEMPIAVVDLSTAEVLREVASIATTNNLSAYDASYLYLAIREGVPLATLDIRLRSAAASVGCDLFE